jgi:hypothetical protein
MNILAASTGWPTEVSELFDRPITCEYASLTRSGAPITWPVTPYAAPGGGTLDVSTGVTYPSKAERARRDPRVALLFSEPTGSGLPDGDRAPVRPRPVRCGPGGVGETAGGLAAARRPGGPSR